MANPRLRTPRVILSTGIAALLGSAAVPVPRSHAADVLKANNTSALNTGASWELGALPTAGDVAVWDSTVTGANTVTLGGDLSLGGLKIVNPGGAVTIGTGNTLTLGASGIDMSAATQALTINSGVALGAAQTWNLGLSGQTLRVGGALSLGANALTLSGGTHFLTGIISGTGAAGSPALTIGGANAANVVLSGANTYTGQTVITSGSILGLSSAGALGSNAVGSETIVQSGGTLNIGGQNINNAPAPATPGEEIRIAGTGVGGIGALINTSGTGTNTLAKVVLTADATISAGGSTPASHGTGGNIITSAGGRIDIRVNAAPTAGQKHLDLGGFTLTKTGGHLLALVNADVSEGNIVVNEGQLAFESNTLVQGNGTVTVNPNGKLGFWSVANAANITRNIVVNGGTVGDATSTGAAQTINAPISIIGAQNPNFVAISGNGTNLAGTISQAGFTGTEVAKRGGGLLTFSNTANSYTVPTTIYAGTLRASFATNLGSGGTDGSPAVTSADTPLGTNSTITIAGGTLSLRANMDNNATVQTWDLGRNIVVDRAQGTMDFDRLSNGSQTNKNVRVTSLTFAAPSAANGYSIGQNQLTFNQGNTHRIEIPQMTMNSDTVLTTGDYILSGNVISAGKNSLVHTGGNSWGFINSGTQDFNALYNIGNATLRVGSMYGTSVTNDTVTAGTGPIVNAPNNSITFRTPTNIADGQTVEVLSQRVNQSTVNFEQFTSVPSNLRALGSGVIGVGSASAFGDIDLSRIGDGTFRIGSNFSGSGNGTIVGTITPGAGDLVRLGAGGTLTVSGENRVTGSAALSVGSDLINGGFRVSNNGTAQNGTVILTGANDYTGGTTVNRSSTLRFQSAGGIGSGAVDVFGTLTAERDATFTADGTTNVNTVRLFGGSTLFLDNSAVTAATDVNRWGDSTPISLNNTTLTVSARNLGASDTIEAFGAMSVAGGNVLNLNRTQSVNGHNVQVTVDSLTRSNGGTLELVRTTGTGAGYTSGQKFLVTNGAPVVTNGMIAPWIVAQNNGPAEFVTYNAATGVGVVTYDNTVTTGTYTAGALNFNGTTGGKVLVTTADLTLQDNPTLYALRSERTINTSGANTGITLRSGGLILRNVTDNTTIDIKPAITANSGAANTELLVHTLGGGTGRNYQISGAITASGLTKFGSGNLLLTTDSPNLTGPVSVNAGTLELRTAGAAGNGTINLAGGQLNVRINGAAATYTNGITVAENIPFAVLDVGNLSTASNASALTFNGASAGTSGLVLSGSPGAQGLTFRLQTNGNGTGSSVSGITFGNNMAHSFTGNVTLDITGTRTLTLNNNPTISGTNPVITKSGDGTLVIGSNGGTPTAADGTTVVLDNGTLEIRSLNTFGSTGATTSLVLNRGTLNLRRDGDSTFGSTAGYPVALNGNATISTDRASSTNNAVHTLGKLTIKDGVTLTVNHGNGYALDFTGAELKGTSFIAPTGTSVGNQNSGARIQGEISGGALVKSGAGYLHLMGSDSTYDGGTYVQQGFLRLRGANAAGTGTVYVNPGAVIDFNNANNLGANQKLVLRSNSAFPTMVSVNTNGVTHPTGANVDFSAAPTGIVGLSNGATVYNNAIDLGSLYGGRWSLGGIPQGAYDPRYTADSLGVGADNLYRLGGGGTAFAMSISDVNGTPRNNVLTGAANSVRLGFDSGNILSVAAGNYQFIIGGTQDFGGDTTIHRGMITRLGSAAAGGKSGLSSGKIDVFGALLLSSTATLQDGGVSTNELVLHPGSMLQLDSNNGVATNMGASNVANRIADTQTIALNGAMLDVIGNNNNATTETLGDTTYSRGARIRAARNGTGSTTLTLNSLSAVGSKGNTLTIQTAGAGTLGVNDRILVSNNAPVPVHGMVNPHIVNATDSTFVTYDAVDGFKNVQYENTFTAAGVLTAGMAPTAKVDINSAGTMTLGDNPVVYALRTNRDINNAGPYNQLTLRSGGLIGFGNALTIQPNLVFNDGTSNVEARIYAGSTVNINGAITADGVVKSGNSALVINVPQTGYASGWVVNSGDLQFSDLNAAGQSGPGNAITVNATQTTSGQASQVFNMSRVIFTRDTGTPELATFTGGPITVVNEGIVRVQGGDNRNLQIPAVTAVSTGDGSSAALTLDVPNNRFRAVIPSLTLESDTIARVLDSGSTGDTGRITAAVVNSLVGTGKNLTKIGNRTLELAGDNSTTFTGGTITVGQGTIRVLHNGSLGSATTTATFERNATLEIAKSNFSPTASVVQQPGSIERWNVEDARSGNYNLPAGVNLQLNTNLVSNTPRTIGLNGGTIEGFLWTDHPATAVQRTMGSAVTVNLLADSSVGQNILQGQSYDAGRGPVVGQPYGDTASGASLRIEGKITGGFNLTKTGNDTVTIASTGNTYNDTIVDMGILKSGATDALPTGKTLTTRLGGTFDMNGFDQTVGGLGTADGGVNPGGVSAGVSGRIVNGGVTDNTLTVNNTANYTYNGAIGQNVALTKNGSGTLTLGGENTYIGNTMVEQGTLAISGSISGTPNIEVKSGATLDVSALTGGLVLGGLQTLKGNGSVTGSLDIAGVVAPTAGASALNVSAAAAFDSGSTLSIEIASPAAFSQLAASSISLDGTVNLSISLGFVPAADSSFVIVNNTGAGAIAGFFTWGGTEGVLTEGEEFFINGQGFTISYQGGAGNNDVVLSAVPEPGTALTLVSGFSALLGMRRFRRRK